MGAAVIAIDAFAVQTKTRWRKLTTDEIRGLCRQGFTHWSTLPDAFQTDNEARLGGHPSDSFPSLLTLWFIGLGIEHRFSRPNKLTDQAQVERQHHILDAWTDAVSDRATLTCFKRALQREMEIHTIIDCPLALLLATAVRHSPPSLSFCTRAGRTLLKANTFFSRSSAFMLIWRP